MDTSDKISITVETEIEAPVDKVWRVWTDPAFIMQWCHASDDWYAPHAENKLLEGAGFKTTMSAKDGSVSFDYEGVYRRIKELELIEYEIADGRKVKVAFIDSGKFTTVIETFEAENIHPIEMQKGGWQAILDNFRKCVESN